MEVYFRYLFLLAQEQLLKLAAYFDTHRIVDHETDSPTRTMMMPWVAFEHILATEEVA
jgi:hypothetical protein